MATHSSVLAWKIPWTEEAGGLQFVELQRFDTTEQLSPEHKTLNHVASIVFSKSFYYCTDGHTQECI